MLGLPNCWVELLAHLRFETTAASLHCMERLLPASQPGNMAAFAVFCCRRAAVASASVLLPLRSWTSTLSSSAL
jgi:hypothetical protein